MKNKSHTLPFVALVAILVLSAGMVAGSIMRTFGTSPVTTALQISPTTQLAHVGSGYVWGDFKDPSWAWSSNIGWISFSGSNTNSGGGTYHVYAATSTASPTVAPIRGYAWSSNVGWISFEQADIDGCPVDSNYDVPISQGGKGASLPTPTASYTNCTPRIDTATRHVSGWGRVLSMRDENAATGWLQLSGTNHESRGGGGVVYDPSGRKITGMAWEPLVLGWIEMNVKFSDQDVAATIPLSASCTSSAGSNPIPAGTTVTFQANGKDGVPPYTYRWGAVSNPFTGVNTDSSVYNTSGSGPTVTVRDTTLATQTVTCPNVNIASAANINFYIGRDSATTKITHSLRKGSKFAVAWNSSYGPQYKDCGVVITPPSGDTYYQTWENLINNGIGFSADSYESGGITNLQTTTSVKGTYTFDFMCVNDTDTTDIKHAAPAILRVIGANDQEE